MIKVTGLRVDYDNFCAVKNIGFEVGAGHVFGLIGPNGSGKTTTMKAILGLLQPTYGRIEVCGIDVIENPEEGARRIGFMPDFPPIYEDLYVWEFLDLFAASYYVPKNERMELVERYLHLVGLTEKRNVFIPGLSRGMRQRLMLAKTLIPDPDVIILDEPASGMDPNGRIDLKNIIKSLAARGKSVLISSHILSEMSEFCTAIGIMERGRMVETGTVVDVGRRVMGHAPIMVELLNLEQEEKMRALLAGDSRAGKVEKIGADRFEIVYEGDVEEAADLLEDMIQAGLRIAAFGRKKEGLEEIFLKVGAKKLR
jgi:ABC-2 type transport system ATP-binding protein